MQMRDLDPQGAGGRAEIAITVLPTQAPVVSILSPVSENRYYADQLIQFSAEIGDEEDEAPFRPGAVAGAG